MTTINTDSNNIAFIVCADGHEVVLNTYSFGFLMTKFFNAADVVEQITLPGMKYWELDMDTMECRFNEVRVVGDAEGASDWGGDDFEVICTSALSCRSEGLHVFVGKGCEQVLEYLSWCSVPVKLVRRWSFTRSDAGEHRARECLASSALLYTADAVVAMRAIYKGGTIVAMHSGGVGGGDQKAMRLFSYACPTMRHIESSGLEGA